MKRSHDTFAILFSLLLCSLFLVVSLSPASAQSSFYKYIDKDGKVTFTDSLDTIPPQYRGQVKEYKGESQRQPEAVNRAEEENGENSAAKGKEAEERKKAHEKAAREKELKAREEKVKQITELQDQLREKQQQQRDLRTTWMVYDKIKLNQLNEEIASLEKQIISLKNELTPN